MKSIIKRRQCNHRIIPLRHTLGSVRRFAPNGLGTAIQSLDRGRSTGEKLNCYYRIYDSKGKIHWLHDEASVVCDESGAPLYASGVMLDISEKREMEAELNEHRYSLERQIELRSEQLIRSMALMESSNAWLTDTLAVAHRKLEMLKQHSAVPAIQAKMATQPMPVIQMTPVVQTKECIEHSAEISDWACSTIAWRVAATGTIA